MDEAVLLRNKPKLAEARHNAKALLKTCGVSQPPVMLNEVVKQLKTEFILTVRGTKDHFPPEIFAITYTDESGTIIGYNENASVTRQRFSVAHEIGHLKMGHTHGQSSIDLDSSDNDEMEANAFAVELLMPQAVLAKDIKNGIKNPEELARRYQVSPEAMWWRLSKTGLINKL
ncbi:hypothetical protein B7Z00_00040 [Candidatus Saccharibacteria bacterium 32-50-10]|nr:MAG: hypothetical protein B7Z00_00040 [Candidatus Saccharibacteria bacterium 32-50-10]